jgi:predicted small integral membrane protein
VSLRVAKIALVLAVALFYSVVVFNNLTDYDSNYQFVRHALMMDSTFPNNRAMWHAVNSPTIHTIFYISIILWESITMILCWWGALRLARAATTTAATFNQAKRVSVVALTVGLLMWLVAFLIVGAEWFLMWQSKSWNGQEAAFRMFTIMGIILIFLALPDSDQQP